MVGDEKRFLDAGMDAYLSKPITAKRLFAMIDSLTSTASAPNCVAQCPPGSSQDPAEAPCLSPAANTE